MNNLILNLLMVALICVFLLKCSPVKEPLTSTQDWSGEPFTLTVIYSENVDRDYRALVNSKDTNSRHGFSIWYPEDRECVIYTEKPKYLKDRVRFETAGHELVHCTDGSFHKE